MAKDKKTINMNLEPEAYEVVEKLSKELNVSMTLVIHALIYSFRKADVKVEISDLQKIFYEKTGPKPRKLENSKSENL